MIDFVVGSASDYKPRSGFSSRRCHFNGDFSIMKKYAVALAVAGMSALAMAEGESGFDPSSLMSSAQTTVTTIVAALGTLLAAAAGIYLAFIGWRAFKAACNKV